VIVKRIGWIAALLAACAAAAVAADNELSQKEKNEGWKLLFDGKTLSGWKTTGKPEGWAVEDGAIACTLMGGGYLYTEEQFGDFVLAIDYKVAPKTNSGIFFRWSDLKDPVHTGIEMQVYDSYGKDRPGKHDAGAIYDIIAPGKNTSKPAGEWNHVVITCRDNLVSVEQNGEKVSEMDLNRWTEAGKNPDGTTNKFKYAYKDLPRRGYIGFQDHGGKVWFRNVKIKPLASTE
jgi:3-keto-disaccharide hydrolase